jgi:hypothetical protein
MAHQLSLAGSLLDKIHPFEGLEAGRKGTGDHYIPGDDALGLQRELYLLLFLKNSQLYFHTPCLS